MEITGDALNVALAQAVMSAFKPEMMSEVFRESLRKYLFEPVKDSYGTKPSPFSQAFRSALDSAAREVAVEFVSMPENMEKIQALMKDAFAEAVASPETKKKIVERFNSYMRL